MTLRSALCSLPMTISFLPGTTAVQNVAAIVMWSVSGNVRTWHVQGFYRKQKDKLGGSFFGYIYQVKKKLFSVLLWVPPFLIYILYMGQIPGRIGTLAIRIIFLSIYIQQYIHYKCK